MSLLVCTQLGKRPTERRRNILCARYIVICRLDGCHGNTLISRALTVVFSVDLFNSGLCVRRVGGWLFFFIVLFGRFWGMGGWVAYELTTNSTAQQVTELRKWPLLWQRYLFVGRKRVYLAACGLSSDEDNVSLKVCVRLTQRYRTSTRSTTNAAGRPWRCGGYAKYFRKIQRKYLMFRMNGVCHGRMVVVD